MEEYDLLQCIDKGLEPFGSNIKQSIYWKMSILHNYSKSEIVENPQLLLNVIKDTLSDTSLVIEKSIAEEIRKVFNLSEEESSTLTDAIENAKKQIINVYSAASASRTKKGLTPPTIRTS